MARTVKEWQGRTDDTPPSTACKLRIVARQGGCCALTKRPFTAKDKPQFDHKVPLWLGGQNRENNLHAIHKAPHKDKTRAEAKVRAKVNARKAKNLGLKRTSKRPLKSAPFPATQKSITRQAKEPLKPRALFGAQP